jgi:hypothetical protein
VAARPAQKPPPHRTPERYHQCNDQSTILFSLQARIAHFVLQCFTAQRILRYKDYEEYNKITKRNNHEHDYAIWQNMFFYEYED